MISEEELSRRKWGKYSALGHILGERAVPEHYYGATSISDNVFNWLNRLANVAVVAREHKADVVNAADKDFANRLPDDLTMLENELRAASEFFVEHADIVRLLRGEFLERAARSRFDEKR